jgi:alpha-galactosidase
MVNNVLICFFLANQNDTIHISVETEYTAVVIRINQNRDPLLIYIGKRLRNNEEYASIPSFDAKQLNGDYTGLYSSAYTSSGTRNLLEPAIQVIHADGNPSLDL